MRLITLFIFVFLLSGCGSLLVDRCVDQGGKSREVCEAEQKNKSPSEISEQQTELFNHWLNNLMIWKR